jgi:hypothetical protein
MRPGDNACPKSSTDFPTMLPRRAAEPGRSSGGKNSEQRLNTQK